MNEFTKYILAGLGGIMLAWIGSKLTRWLDSRIRLSSPESRAIAEIVPTINMMAATYGSLLYGTKTLLEVTQGNCNGNVDESLNKINEGVDVYEKYVSQRLIVRGTK